MEFNALTAVELPPCQLERLAGGNTNLWRRLIDSPGGAARMSLLIHRRLGIDQQVRLDELVEARSRFGLLRGADIMRLLSFAAAGVMTSEWCNLVQQQDRERARRGLGDQAWEFVTQRSRLTVAPLGKRYGIAIGWETESSDVETMLAQHITLQLHVLQDLIDDRSPEYQTRVRLKLPESYSNAKTSSRTIAREEAWTLVRRLIQQELEPRWQSCFV